MTACWKARASLNDRTAIAAQPKAMSPLGYHLPMLDTRVLAFTGIAAVLTLTPGADTMLVVRSAAFRGRRAGFLTVLGIGSGLFIHATLSALGLSVVLVRSARAFELVKAAGALYLVYLGIQAIRSAWRATPVAPSVPRPSRARRAFLEGLLTNVLNPKVAVFYLAFLPQFIGPHDPVLARSILLASVHFAEGVVWLSLVTLFVTRFRSMLTQPRVRRAMESASGVAFIGFGVKLAVSRR